MKKFEDAYEICRKKALLHMKNFDGTELYEVSAVKGGDYYAEGNRVDFFHMYNWTTSFITGLAPLFCKTHMESGYIIWANRFKKFYREKIFEHSTDTMHDIGFLYSPYSAAMYELTGDEEHKVTAVKAADELMKRFDINARLIDAWGRMDNDKRKGRAIIDCMMNIQLLFWAWKETGHTMYRDVAKAHADTTGKYFIRKDGSVCHSFNFDRKSGAVLEENNDCGFSNGSYWARGAAWAAYGFAMTARYLSENEYLKTAEMIADTYISQLPEGNFVPVWDFRLPKETPALYCGGDSGSAFWDETLPKNCEYNADSSAAAIMACALMEINNIKPNKKYMDFADKSLSELCTQKYLDTDINIPGMLKRQNGRMTYTTFGDYFFAEALQRRIYNKKTCW